MSHEWPAAVNDEPFSPDYGDTRGWGGACAQQNTITQRDMQSAAQTRAQTATPIPVMIIFKNAP